MSPCPPQYISVDEQPGFSLSYKAVLQPLSLANYDQVRNINISMLTFIFLSHPVQIVYGDLKNTGYVAVK